MNDLNFNNYQPGDFTPEDLEDILKDPAILNMRDAIIFDLVNEGLVEIVHDAVDSTVKFIVR